MRRFDGVYGKTRAVIAEQYLHHPIRFFSIVTLVVAIGFGLKFFWGPITFQTLGTEQESALTDQSSGAEKAPTEDGGQVLGTTVQTAPENAFLTEDHAVIASDQPLEVEIPEKGLEPEVEVHGARAELSGKDDFTITLDDAGQNEKITITPNGLGAKPGLYEVVIKNPETGAVLKTEKIAWGVLAFNPDYAVYPPGTQANLAFAVLDDRGKMVCNADLTLEITNPDGGITTLRTADKTIVLSPDCQVYGPTSEPDYHATYQTGPDGQYRIQLVAKVGEVTRTLTDTFSVKRNEDFYLKRELPTRIYPPTTYEAKLIFQPKQSGTYQVEEFVPKGFEISETKAEIIAEDTKQILRWSVEAQSNQDQTLSYRFKAPNISPYLFLVGPLTIENSKIENSTKWAEPRSWQIASDNACQSAGTGNWSDAANWTSCGGTVPQAADTVQILNTHNVTEDTASVTVAGVTIDNGGTLTVSTTNAITVSGNWSNSGTFTSATGTVTFSSTVTGKTLAGTMTGATGKFYNVIFNGAAGSWILQAAMETANNFDITNGTFDTKSGSNYALTVGGNLTGNTGTWTFEMRNSTITVSGNWDTSAVATDSTSLSEGGSNVVMNGTGTKTIKTGATNTYIVRFHDLTVGQSGNTTQLLTNSTAIGGTIYLGTGTFNLNSLILYINSPDATPLSLNASGTWGTGNGTFTIYNSSNSNLPAFTYNSSFTTEQASFKTTFQGTTTITGNLTLGCCSRASEVDLNGQTVTVNGNVLFNTTTAILTMGAANLTVKGNWTNSNGAVFNAGTSTVDFAATSGTQTVNTGGTSSTKQFYNLTHSGASTLSLTTNALQVANDLSNTGGTMSGTVNATVNGNATGVGAITMSGTSTFTQRVAASKNFGTTSSTGVWTFVNLTFSNSTGSPAAAITITTQTGGSGGITVSGILLVGASGDTAGATTTLDAGNRTWTLSGTGGDPFQLLASPAGALTGNTSTFKYTGVYASGNTIIQSATYYNLTLTTSGASAETYVLEGTTGTSNDLAVTFGTLDTTASNYALNVARDLTLSNSTVVLIGNGSTITVGNDFNDVGNKFTEGTASTVNMTGTADNAGTLNSTSQMYNLQLAGSGKTITVGTSMNQVNGVMTLNGGTVSDAASYINLAGTTSKTPLVFGAATTLSGGAVLSYRITGGTNVTFTMAGGNYGDWRVGAYTSGTNDSIYNFAGDITTTGVFGPAADTALTGTTVNTQNFALTASYMEYGDSTGTRNGPVAVNFGSSTVTFSSTTSSIQPHSTGGGTSSTLNLGSSSVTISGALLFSNGTGALTVTPGTSTVTWVHTSGSKTYAPNGQSLYNVILNGSGGTVTPSGAVDINNDLTMTAGTLAGTQNITVNGNVAGTAGIMSLTGGTFKQMVSSDKNFGTTSGSTAWTFSNLSFTTCIGICNPTVTITTQTGGTGGITVTGVLTVGDAGDSSITALNAGNRTWTLSGTGGDPFQLTASPAATLTGATSTFAYTGVYASGNTTIQSSASSYTNLTINAAETFVLEGTTTVTGNLTISAGTLDVTASNHALNIGGNYSNSGTFTAQSGTVTLNGSSTQTLSGGMLTTNAFYNLTVTNSSGTNADDCELTSWVAGIDFSDSATVTNNLVMATASTRVEFNSGSTYTFNNINWNGQATGTKIYFRNSAASGAWNLAVSGTQTAVSYLNVSRSDATGGNTINANNNTNTDCGANVNWEFGKSVSGVVYLTNETTIATTGNGGPCDSATAIVSARVNGGTAATTTCSSSTAAYSVYFSTTPTAGQTITIYLTSASKGNTVTLSDGASNTGVDIYIDHVITRHENAGPMTNTAMNQYDIDQNATDMLFTAAVAPAITLSVTAGKELHVASSKTFTPGGTVTTGLAGDVHIVGTLSMGGNALSIGGSYNNAGTFTSASNTTTFTSTASGKTLAGTMTGSSAFYDLTFNGVSGAWTFSAAVAATNDFTVTNGSVTANGNNLTVTRDFILANTAGVDYVAGSTTVTVSRHWTDSGCKFTEGTSTIAMTGTGTISVPYSTCIYNLSVGYSTFNTTFPANAFYMTGVLTYNGGTATAGAGGYFQMLVTSANSTPIVFASATTLTGSYTILVQSNAAGPLTITVAGGNYGSWGIDVNAWNSGITYQLAGDVTTTGMFRQRNGSGGDTIFNTQNFNITAANYRFGQTGSGCLSTTANWGSSTITLTGTFQNNLYVDSNCGAHTLNMGSANVTVKGYVAFINGTGTITVDPGTSTLTWNHTSGTSTYAPNGQSLYNMTLNGSGGTVTPSGTVSVTNDLTITLGTFDTTTSNYAVNVTRDVLIANSASATFRARGSTITVSRDWSKGSSGVFTRDSSTVQLNGTGQILTVGGGQTQFENLTVAYNTKTTTMATARTDVFGVLTIGDASGGTMTCSVTCEFELFRTAGADLVLGTGATLSGSSATFQLRKQSAATVTVTGATNYGTWNILMNADPSVAGLVTFNVGGNITTSGYILVKAKTSSTATFNTQNYTINADKWVQGDSTANGVTTSNWGSSAATFSRASATDTFYVNSNGGAQVANFQTANISATGNVLFVNGTGTLTVTASTSTFTFAPTTGTSTYAPNGQSLYNVIVNGAATVQPNAAVAITNDLTMTAGTLNGTQNVTVNGNIAGTAGIISLTGGTFTQRASADKNFGTTSGSTAWTFSNLTFSNACTLCSGSGITFSTQAGTGGVTVSGVLKVGDTGDGDNSYLNAGAGGRTWTLSGTGGDPFQILTGAEAGDLTANVSTFTYTGANAGGNTTIQVATYCNLSIGGTTADTYVLEGATITSNAASCGDLTIVAPSSGSNTLDTVSGSNHALTIGGNYANNSVFTAQSGTVTFSATDTGNTLAGTLSGSSAFYNLVFNGSGGEWTPSAAVAVSNDLTVTAGSLLGTQNLTVSGGDITGNGTINLTSPSTTTLTSDGNFGGATAWTFYTLKFGNTSTLVPVETVTATGAGGITVTDVLTINKHSGLGCAMNTLNAGSKTWTLSGTTGSPLVVSGTLTPSTSTVTFTGNNAGGNTNVPGSGAACGDATYYNLTLNNGSETYAVSGTTNLTVNNDLTITAGTFTAGSGTTTIGNNYSNSGTFTANSGTVTFSATDTGNTLGGTLDGTSAFYNLIFGVSGSPEWTPSAAVAVTNDLTMTAGSLLGTQSITVAGGDIAGNGTITLTGGTVTLTGTGNFGGDTAWTFYNLNFGTASTIATATATGTGAITVSNVLTLAVTGLEVPSVLNAGSKTWTLSGSTGTPFVENGTFTASTSLFKFTGNNGSGNSSIPVTGFNDLELDNTLETYTSGVGLTVSDDLTITNGTFSVGASATINGDLTNNGTLTANTSTITLGGSALQTISGTLTGGSAFYNLTISNSSGAVSGCSTSFTPGVSFASAVTISNLYTITTGNVKVQYNSGSTYAVNNMNWNGGGTSIYFRNSNLEGGTWLLNVTAVGNAQTKVSYVDVGRSDASSGAQIIASDGTNTDCSFNTNWQFDETLTLGLDTTSISFGTIQPGVMASNQTNVLTASSNANNGYAIYAWATQAMTMVRGADNLTIADWTGTNASPTTWASGAGFGYTTDDTSIACTTGDVCVPGDRFATATKFAGYTNTGPGKIVADRTAPVTGATNTITYRLGTDATQAAGTYSTVVVYIISTTFP